MLSLLGLLLLMLVSIQSVELYASEPETSFFKFIDNGLRLSHDLTALLKSPGPFTSDVVKRILELDSMVVAQLRECKSANIVAELEKWPDTSPVRKRYLLMYLCCKAAHYAALVTLQPYL